MEKRYSQMTPEELRREIAELKVKAQRAEQMGMINEVAVYERKMAMAEAYLMDPKAFKKGGVYKIKYSDAAPFTIAYMKGVFAWGHHEGSDEWAAYPISLLEKYEGR